jgi:hypothetical protein
LIEQTVSKCPSLGFLKGQQILWELLITANIRSAFGLGFAIFFSVKIIAFEVILQKSRLSLFLKQFRDYQAIMSPVLRTEKHRIFANRYVQCLA